VVAVVPLQKNLDEQVEVELDHGMTVYSLLRFEAGSGNTGFKLCWLLNVSSIFQAS
jgi:hypothetical protein